MPNLLLIVLSIFLAWVGYPLLTTPPARRDCLSPADQLDQWYKQELPEIQRRMEALVDPWTPTSKLWVIDECLGWIGSIITEEEIQEWRSKENFQGHFITTQLRDTCSLFAQIESLKKHYYHCNMETVLQALVSQIDNHLNQTRFWMKIWHFCQIDSHMAICRISLLKK